MIRPRAALLALVGGTTATFAHADRSTTSATRRRRRTPPAAPDGHGLAVGLERREQRLVAQRGHLHDLAQRGPQLALGERPEDGDVQHDRRRVVERADQVLALGQVHAGLAADRRVHLGDERRRARRSTARPAGTSRRGTRPGPRARRRPRRPAARVARPAGAAASRAAVLDRPPAVFAASPAGSMTTSTGHPSARSAVGEPLADRRPRPGLGDEHRAPRLQPAQRRPDRLGRDPVADDQLADRRRRAQQRRRRRRRRPSEPVDGAHHRATSARPLTRVAAP